MANSIGYIKLDERLLINTVLQMIEGCLPFSAKQDTEVPKVYAASERPPFRASAKHYAHGLKESVL